MTTSSYTSRPCFAELIVILVLGATHVVVELHYSESVAFVYNAAISVGFSLYLVWRVISTPGVLRTWGMRRDNFSSALRAQLPFGIVAVVALVGYGLWSNSFSLPFGFWVTVGLYPIWGIAQQFALQNLVARNVAGFLRSSVSVAITASTLFAFSHFPRIPLVVLTLVSGFFFTLAYRRQPNLWAVGIVHGILGSLAVYLVLQEDPGGVIWTLLTQR